MKNNTTSKPQRRGDILDELQALVGEAEKMISSAQAEANPEALGALRARFGGAQERLSELYGDTRKKVMDGAWYTDEVVRANPYQSIAIAAGVGLLVGVLVGR